MSYWPNTKFEDVKIREPFLSHYGHTGYGYNVYAKLNEDYLIEIPNMSTGNGPTHICGYPVHKITDEWREQIVDASSDNTCRVTLDLLISYRGIMENNGE